MAYDEYQYDKPDPTADTGTTAFTNTRRNFLALRDAIVAGISIDWSFVITSRDADDNPLGIVWAKQSGNEWVRQTITWNANGTPATMKMEYAAAAGAWVAMGTPGAPLGLLTLTYNATTELLETGDWT